MSAAMHALITGGSSGIGKAMGRKLAAAGYSVSLIARRGDVLAEAMEEIRHEAKNADQRFAVYSADLADREAAEAAVQAAIADLGPPDLVVTSAGVAAPGYFADMAVATFERTMAVNYFGTLYVLKAVLPAMQARRSGHLVLISSGAALMGVYGYASYGSSKFAVRGLAETLRAELRADNIGVSVAYPPDTETPMLEAEREAMPPETKLICDLAKTWTADAVADFILRGVARGHSAITPGLTLTLMNRLPGVIIPILRAHCDRLVAGVRRDRAQHTRAPRAGLRAAARHAFMTLWYPYARTLNSLWPSITLDGKRLVVFANVYKPLENEQASGGYCRVNDRVLDLGCGSGVGTVFCAPKAREVVAVDISLPAVRNTEENCRRHGLQNVTVLQSDMFSRVEGRFDLILANSPYIEDDFKDDERQFATSVRYIPTLFAEAGDYLNEDGRLLLQFPSGAQPQIEALAGAHGLELISVRSLPERPLKLLLLSTIYLQVGFKSALFLLQKKPVAKPAGAETEDDLPRLKAVA